MVGKKLFGLVQVMLVLLLAVQPLFLPAIRAYKYEIGNQKNNINLGTTDKQQSPFVYGFNTVFTRCLAASKNSIGYSGSFIYITPSANGIFAGVLDKVYVFDTVTGGIVTSPTIRGAKFSSDTMVYGHAVSVKDEVLVVAPSGSNPYVVYSTGSSFMIPIYDGATASKITSFQIIKSENYYVWVNSKGIVYFTISSLTDPKPYIIWQYDLSSEGGAKMAAISSSTIAAVSSSNVLYLFKRNMDPNDNTPLLAKINNVYAVAQARRGYYIARDVGNGVTRIYLMDERATTFSVNFGNGQTIDIRGAVASMRSDTNSGYDVLFVVSSNGLSAFVIDQSVNTVANWMYWSLVIRDVSATYIGGVVYFVTIGTQVLVGHITGTSIIVDGLKSNPYPSVAAYIVPGNPALKLLLNLTSGRTMLVSMPPNSMLLGELISRGGCVVATMYVPVQVLTGPHIEVSGRLNSSFSLGTGNKTSVRIDGVIPYGINMRVDSITYRKLYSELVQQNIDPQPVSYNTNYNGSWYLDHYKWVAAESNSEWEFNVTDGVPRATFDYRAVWHHPEWFAPVGSFPAASIGIWYYNIIPTPINQYDSFSLRASVTSTNVILDAPGWYQFGTITYGVQAGVNIAIALTGPMLKYGVIALATKLGLAGEASASDWLIALIPAAAINMSKSKLDNNKDKYNAVKSLLNEQALKQSNIMDAQINALYKNSLITRDVRDSTIAGIGNTLGMSNIPLSELYYYYMQAMQYGHTDIYWDGVLSINTGGTGTSGAGYGALGLQSNKFMAKALDAGLSTSEVGQILKLAIEDSIKAQVSAAMGTLNEYDYIDSAIYGLSSTFDLLKQRANVGALYINASGTKIQLTTSDIDAYINTFMNSVARYANASATLYSIATGMTATKPEPSINTLFYIYEWGRQAMLWLGADGETAINVGTILMSSAFLAALEDATMALVASLKNRGINIGTDTARGFSIYVLDVAMTLGSVNMVKDKLNMSYKPRPELIAQLFEKYAREYISSKQSSQSVKTGSVNTEAIRELADMIRNAKVVIVPPGEDPKKYVLQDNNIQFLQITWQTKNVNVKPVGASDPLMVLVSGQGGKWQALIGGLSIMGMLIGLAVPVVGLAILGASFALAGLAAVQSIVYALVVDDASRAGMAVLRGFVFDVDYIDSRKVKHNMGIFVLDPLPNAIAYRQLFGPDVKVSDCFKNVLEGNPQKFGYEQVKVYFTQIGNDFDIKGIIKMFTNDSSAVIKRVGVAVVPAAWIQPPPSEDVSVDAEGFIEINEFSFSGVINRQVEITIDAGLTPQLWSQIKIIAYHVDSYGGKQILGEFYLYRVDNQTLGKYNLYKNGLFMPGGLYWGANGIEIQIPQSMSTYTARFTLNINATLVAPINGTQQPYMAIVYYNGEAGFKPSRLGIYNLDQLPGYPRDKPLVAIQVGAGASNIPIGNKGMNYYMIIGDPVSRASISGSPYNYLFYKDTDKLLPFSGTYFYAIYWLYYEVRQIATCYNSTTPTNPFDNKNIRLIVSPTSNKTVLPAWLDVAPGDLGLAVFVNGTESHSTLPRMTTTYIYTKEPTMVSVQTEFVALVERNDPRNYSRAGWFPYYIKALYNVSFMTPGEKCQVALNYWIKNFTDYIVDQSRQLNATFVIYTRSKAVRLDNGVTKEAESPHTSIFPFIQGNLTNSAPKFVVRVYNALNNSPVPNATVMLHGSVTVSGLTNSTGYFNVTVPKGSYTLLVNKTGYNTYTEDLYLMMDTLMNVPLVPIVFNNATSGWLIVYVRTIDGVPLMGASVYINGTFMGTTDTNGQWAFLFKANTNQTIEMAYGNWSETRTLKIVSGRTLTTSVANVYSKIFTPMVYAYGVYTQSRVYSNYSLIIQGGVITNSNNTYTVEVGIKTMDGKIIAKKNFTQTVSGPGTHPFIVFFDAPPDKGVYKPYMNITWAKRDNSYIDNYVEGNPFSVVDLLFLTLSIELSVINWGKNVMGLVYPGDTKFNVTLESWLVDSALSNMDYDRWLALRRGQSAKLNSTINMKIDVMAGTTSFVTISSKTVQVSKLQYGTSVLFNDTVPAPYARFMVIMLEVPNLGNVTIGNTTLMNTTIISSDKGDIVVKFRGYNFKLPPHIIVKGIDQNTLLPIRLGDNMSISMRVWTNYLPGEGSRAVILLGFRMQDNTTLVGISSAPVPPIHDGEQTIKALILVPSDLKYNFSWFEPYKKFTAIFTVAQTPDSYPYDNFAKADITVLNTDSFVTWLLIGMGVITALIIILAFIHAIRGRDLSRVIMSEWFERVPEKTIPSRSVHRRRKNSIFNLEWFERINKDEEK
jgi:hypothetical protein